MKTQDHLKIPLECYNNGELILPSMGEAIDMLFKAHHGIIVPLNLYAWNVNGFQGYNDDWFDVSGEKPIQLGIFTHVYHGQPITIDIAEAMINCCKELTQELFIAWAAKFNYVFRKEVTGEPLAKKDWPLRFTKVQADDCSVMRPAYQMRKDRTSFVIMGIDRDQLELLQIPNWSFLWREFLRRYYPNSQKRPEKVF